MNSLTVIEHGNQRVLTTQQLAEVYETDPNNIKNNFSRNRDRFIEGRDFYFLVGENLQEFKNSVTDSDLVGKNANSLYLWTSRGANRHCKILDTDQAWKQFDVLEETYFRVTQMQPKQMSQAELTAMIAQNQVEIERTANTALEIANKASRQITNALDVFAAPVDKDWRQSMNAKMRGICQEHGLSYLVFYHDLYEELEDVARVNLQSRLSRLRARLQKEGVTKTACKSVTKLEVIERDPKLRPIFEGIVRKYQAKYAVA